MIPEDFFDTEGTRALLVKLRCLACSKRFSRKFEWAMVSPDDALRSEDWDGILLSDVVTCPQCRVVDEYSIEPESKAGLSLRILVHATEDGRPYRVAMGSSRLWDGTIVRRPTQALEHLRTLTTTHPRSAQAFRCLGNACSRWRQNDEALAAWRRACELDDQEIDAALSLAGHLLKPLEDHVEGFFYLRRAIAAIPSAVRAHTVSGDIVQAAFRLLAAFVEHCEDDIALMAAWSSDDYRDEPVVTMSAVDLRKVRDFERLAELARAGHFVALGLTPDLPDEDETTNLERLLANSAPHEIEPRRFEEVFPHAARRIRPASPVSRKSPRRNAPCPCGSDRKFKRCCGRPRGSPA